MDDQSAAKGERAPRSPGNPLDGERVASQYGWVRAVAYNLVRDPTGAEDVTQETLLAALAAPPRDVPDDQRLRAWLGRVAFNLSRLGARQGARRRAREQRVARHESQPSVSDELEASGTIDALSAAIAGLEEPYRGVVLMRYFDQLSTAEIAARTNTSELAVRKRLWRARNKLRAAIDHDPESGRILAALLSMNLAARGWRELGLTGLAAAVVVCTSAVWWPGTQEHAPGSALLASLPAATRTALAVGSALPSSASGGPAAERGVPDPGASGPGPRRQESRGAPPSPPAPEARAAFLDGFVVDLDNRFRGGLELFDAALPRRVLATSDAAGAFRIALEDLDGPSSGLALAARGSGWTTLVPARPAGARAVELPVVVAPAADLDAEVRDEWGRPLPGARFEVRCEERAFTRLDFPVRLDSAVLATFAADTQGRCRAPALARAEGILLAIGAEGFEPLALSTAVLGPTHVFVLRSTPPEPFLTGTVLRRNGEPAVGATVTLAEGRTTADSQGRFRLPLRGVSAHSVLEAAPADKSADPAKVPDFGSRLALAQGGDLELVLGEEYDPVEGKLVADESGGWLVAAYRVGGLPLDESGLEPPAAVTRSDAEGRFAFSLPRGLYDLYAVAPGVPRVARGAALGTQWGHWSLDAPGAPAPASSGGTLVADDGLPLERAALRVHVRLDGRNGQRRLSAAQIESDFRGTFAFEHAPGLELEFEVTHLRLGRQAVTLAATALGSGTDGVLSSQRLSRPAFVRVSAAPAGRCSFLGDDGEVLLVHGPLHAARSFTLSSGASPVLEVPAGARWIQFHGDGLEPWSQPLEARPGQVLELRP